MKKRRREGANWYIVYWAKCWSWNDENAIDFRLSDLQEEVIAWLTSLRASKSKLMRKIFKKMTGWLFDDCGIIPNEKKN